MSIDTSALFAEAKALGMYEEPKRKRAITHRRYNVSVDGEIVAQSCTMADVRILRQKYREDNKPIEINEVYTKLPPPDLPKTGQYAVAEVKGIQNFATPTYTETKAKEKAKRNRKEPPSHRVIARVIENPWRDRNSTLYNEYMKGVERNGFIVTEKTNGNIIYYGQRNEVIAYLKNYMGDINNIKCFPFTKKIRKGLGL